MKYNRFEDLPVWNAAVDLKLDVDELCEQRSIAKRRNWVDQIDRASLSISNNIAEGFERGTTNELLMFLYIARGSAGEVRSMLRLLDRKLQRSARRVAPEWQSEISDLRSQISDLIGQCESVSRQLYAWAMSLQDGDIKGVRHLTTDGKTAYHQAQRAGEFWERIRQQHEARFGTALQPPSD
jgi:four helix bundle protein